PAITPSEVAASDATTAHSVASIASFQATLPVAASSAATTAPGSPRSAIPAARPVPPSAAATTWPARTSGPPEPSSSVCHAGAVPGRFAEMASIMVTAVGGAVNAVKIVAPLPATPDSVAPGCSTSSVCAAIEAVPGPRGAGQPASQTADNANAA